MKISKRQSNNDKLFAEGLDLLEFSFREMILSGRIKVKKRDIMNLSKKRPLRKSIT
jgi:hypothetical protein